jgi:hypothetical protein
VAVFAFNFAAFAFGFLLKGLDVGFLGSEWRNPLLHFDLSPAASLPLLSRPPYRVFVISGPIISCAFGAGSTGIISLSSRCCSRS